VAPDFARNKQKGLWEIANPLVFHTGGMFLRPFSGERDSPPASAPARHSAGRGKEVRASGVVAFPESFSGLRRSRLATAAPYFPLRGGLLRVSAPPHHAFSGGQRDGANPSAHAEERPAWEAGLFRGICWLIRTPNASWNASSGVPYKAPAPARNKRGSSPKFNVDSVFLSSGFPCKPDEFGGVLSRVSSS